MAERIVKGSRVPGGGARVAIDDEEEEFLPEKAESILEAKLEAVLTTVLEISFGFVAYRVIHLDTVALSWSGTSSIEVIRSIRRGEVEGRFERIGIERGGAKVLPIRQRSCDRDISYGYSS